MTMPETDTKPIDQMSTTLMTDSDVRSAFKLFLNRPPLPTEDISPLYNSKPAEFLYWIMNTPEFLSRPGSHALILNMTKKVQEFQKLNSVKTG